MDRSHSADLEGFLQGANGVGSSRLLRHFACECSRRVAHLCGEPIYLRLLEFAEGRASGSVSGDQQTTLLADSAQLYDALHPGYGTPSATTLALAAAGEAAFTESPLAAAINASDFAALAKATSVAESADDAQYDAIHEAAYRAEREDQLNTLKQFYKLIM
jgi:hypothetical protein